MKSMNMNELVAGVRVGKGRSETVKEYARSAEWPNCSHAGCPLQGTIKAENITCTYHYREHGYSADCITEAVKEYEGHLKKYTQMVHWNVRQWQERRSQLMGGNICPATEEEMNWPNKYLNRFRRWIDTSIRERGEEIYKNGV